MNLSNFILEEGVYCQKDFSTGEFEHEYLSIRQKEGRILDDEVVKRLPFIDHPEWKIRAKSAKKLAAYLKKEKCKSVIEIGCGNGWLTNYIRCELNVPAMGIDVGKLELKQAARISERRATFVYGDVFSMNDLQADAIILAACIQYFPDPDRLVKHLNGTIHIIDSPFYEEVDEARERSRKYFRSKDAPGMERFYFHHKLIKDAEVLYRPNRIKVWLGGSPFPWLKIHR